MYQDFYIIYFSVFKLWRTDFFSFTFIEHRLTSYVPYNSIKIIFSRRAYEVLMAYWQVCKAICCMRVFLPEVVIFIFYIGYCLLMYNKLACGLHTSKWTTSQLGPMLRHNFIYMYLNSMPKNECCSMTNCSQHANLLCVFYKILESIRNAACI